MKYVNRKTALLFISLVMFVSVGSSAIESIQGTNIFPDSEVRFRDTEVIAELTSDSTTTTTVELWIQKPDETWFQANSPQTVTVKSGNPRKLSFAIESDNLDQYGNYDFRLNETNNGLESTIQTELVPRPDVTLSNPTTIRINGQQDTYFNLDINTFVGEQIPVDELVPGNITILRITDNSSTPNKIEKNIEVEKPLTVDNQSSDLEAYIDTTQLPTGSYELRANTNISSCDVCEVYETTTSDVVNIGEDYAFNIYDQKWSGFNANDILTNQGTLDEKVEENENKIDRVNSRLSSLEDESINRLVWIWRGSVLLTLFLTIGFIGYYSDNNSQHY